jgi:hypothetical protein
VLQGSKARCLSYLQFMLSRPFKSLADAPYNVTETKRVVCEAELKIQSPAVGADEAWQVVLFLTWCCIVEERL